MKRMIDDYEIKSKLGRGAFGFVVLAQLSPDTTKSRNEEVKEEIGSSPPGSLKGEELVAIKIL